MLWRKKKNFREFFAVYTYLFLCILFCIQFPRPHNTKKKTEEKKKHEKEKQISKLNELLQTLNIFIFERSKHSDLWLYSI